jgi:hypothetical protein
MKRIISLTSIPSRFPYLFESLKSLLDQNAADEVRLYIPKEYRRFPEYDGRLPNVPEGVTICQIENDLGPATKILPACRDFKGEDVQILFCDDDGSFPSGWAKKLFEIQLQRPTEAVATWGRPIGGYVYNAAPPKKNKTPAQQIRIEHDIRYRFERILQKIFGYIPIRRPMLTPGYVDVFFGVCGVVVRPDFFDEEASNIPDEARMVDDVWLSGQLARKKISIYTPRRLPCPRSSEAVDQDSLLDLEFQGSSRQELNRKAATYCQKKYGIWQ